VPQQSVARKGNDWTSRYPFVVEAVNHPKVRSCVIDGEVVCCDEKGVTAFHLLRHRRNEPQAFLYAFDLLELNGTDLRREPIEARKATLASILRKARHGVRLNEHLEHPEGAVVFQHACKMGLEGIVSKRLGSRYRSRRSPDWLKFKNPDAPAVKREAEEDWANKKWDSVGPAVTGFPAHGTQSREKGFKCGDLFLIGDFYCFAHHAA
jgi:ATP-dependent DNA ligase